MLKICSSCLLLTDIPSFAERVHSLAEEAGVVLAVEAEWNSMYRVRADMIMLGSKYLDSVSRDYYPLCTLILKKGESPFPYIREGIGRFIFDYANDVEIAFSFYQEIKKPVEEAGNFQEVVEQSSVKSFTFGDYDFNFADNQFRYRGKPIYLNPSYKLYLALWLLKGIKDNTKRKLVYDMRRKFGDGFLRDIDKSGQIRS